MICSASRRRVLIERNVFEHNWVAAQNGYAVLFTPQNQDGGAPWTVVSDVTFRFNIVRHSASGINLLGADYGHRSEQMRRIKVEHNLFYDIGGEWGGQGSFLQIGNQPAQLVFDHNTVLQSGSIMIVYGNGDGRPLPIDDLHFTNNLVFHNDTGIVGDGVGIRQRRDRRVYAPGDDPPQRDRRWRCIALSPGQLLPFDRGAGRAVRGQARRRLSLEAVEPLRVGGN